MPDYTLTDLNEVPRGNQVKNLRAIPHSQTNDVDGDLVLVVEHTNLPVDRTVIENVFKFRSSRSGTNSTE